MTVEQLIKKLQDSMKLIFMDRKDEWMKILPTPLNRTVRAGVQEFIRIDMSQEYPAIPRLVKHLDGGTLEGPGVASVKKAEVTLSFFNDIVDKYYRDFFHFDTTFYALAFGSSPDIGLPTRDMAKVFLTMYWAPLFVFAFAYAQRPASILDPTFLHFLDILQATTFRTLKRTLSNLSGKDEAFLVDYIDPAGRNKSALARMVVFHTNIVKVMKKEATA